MIVHNNYSLKDSNTFRIDVNAKYFVEVKSEENILEVLAKYKEVNKLVIGKGANILFTRNFDGLVIKNLITGKRIVKETKRDVVLEIGAGEDWDKLVRFSVDRGLGGIENLIYIPGTVGAAPVQNIAAYGQNFSDIFISLDAIDTKNCKKVTFEKDQCNFRYRDSRFKSDDQGRYIITKVRIILSKNSKINTSYFETGRTFAKNVSLIEELKSIAKPPYSTKDVSKAVLNIRKKKLPEVSAVGTAGSFFKNPTVTMKKYEELKIEDPDLQAYPVEDLNYVKNLIGNYVKIPAGRLLDNIGWKGKRIRNVGTFETQALAVVNYGSSPLEILNFTKKMATAIFEKYGIKLEPEVQII